jgi:hypothetical protein
LDERVAELNTDIAAIAQNDPDARRFSSYEVLADDCHRAGGCSGRGSSPMAVNCQRRSA